MQRAGQTPHGARPNREGARNFGSAHAPARRVKPPGRSLEPGSDAGPRGMAVPPERSGGQNSAYRSGCHKLLLSITSKANKARCDAGATRLLGQRQRAFGNWNARQLFGRNNPLITSSLSPRSSDVVSSVPVTISLVLLMYCSYYLHNLNQKKLM